MATTDPALGDPKISGTPAWWLLRLEKKLRDRCSYPLYGRPEGIELYERYYRGEHNLRFATERFREAFGRTLRAFADNWCPLVVNIVGERMSVEGFRIPGDPEADGVEELTTGDKKAWEIWQANGMDAGSHEGMRDALVDSISYVLVGPGDPYPEITPESALQVVTEQRAGYRRERLAGLKRWQDETGFLFATLYLPTEVYKLVSTRSVGDGWNQDVTWIPRDVSDETWPLRNPIGIVPIVPLPNDPRILTDGVSELHDVIPIQDAVNKLFMDMLVASEYAGFRQRWATGIEIPKDPETNQPIASFLKQSLDRVWVTQKSEAQFGTFEATDLSNYVKAIELGVQHIATRTQTPPHYFYLSGQFPSGESLRAAEAGLVSKARRKMRHFGEAFEEAVRLAFLFEDNQPKAKAALAAETIWADPETRTEAEHIDALTKEQSFGIPAEILWEKAGYSPQEIERIKQIKAAESAPTAPSPPAAPADQGVLQ